jgi:hypothetical protein
MRRFLLLYPVADIGLMAGGGGATLNNREHSSFNFIALKRIHASVDKSDHITASWSGPFGTRALSRRRDGGHQRTRLCLDTLVLRQLPSLNLIYG